MATSIRAQRPSFKERDFRSIRAGSMSTCRQRPASQAHPRPRSDRAHVHGHRRVSINRQEVVLQELAKGAGVVRVGIVTERMRGKIQ